MRTWFILHNDEYLGPYSLAELRFLIQKNDMVRKAGSDECLRADTIPELGPLFENVNQKKIGLPSASKGWTTRIRNWFFFFRVRA